MIYIRGDFFLFHLSFMKFFKTLYWHSKTSKIVV